MSIETVIALIIASFVLMATPGPGVLATVARGLAHGLRGSMSFILGIVAGDLVYLLLAIFGLAAIAESYGELFIFVRWAGAAYLIYLGIKAWCAPVSPIEGVSSLGVKPFRDFIGGLSLTLGNPKVIVFYTAFLPTFLDLSTLMFQDILIAASIIVGMLILVLVSYAWMADRSRRLFRSARAMRIMNRSAGGVMIGAGAVIAVRQ